MATVITPNLPEAEALSGLKIASVADMRAAATILLSLGVPAVLLKGGHLEGDDLTDLLATPEGTEAFTATRIPTKHTHGTGCTTASAVAAGLAQGMTLRDAVVRARPSPVGEGLQVLVYARDQQDLFEELLDAVVYAKRCRLDVLAGQLARMARRVMP